MADTTKSDASSDAVSDEEQQNPDELEAQIIATRERLASSVDDLAEAANPVALAESGVRKVKDWFVDPSSGLRADRVAKVAAGVVGFLVLRGIVRRGS